MSLDDAIDVMKRMTAVKVDDMSPKDEYAYFRMIMRFSEEMKPFDDKYAPEDKAKKLPKSQSGIFEYIDGELRRLE